MELLELNIEEEIEEKKESYNEIVDSKQSRITLEKKLQKLTQTQKKENKKKIWTYKWK